MPPNASRKQENHSSAVQRALQSAAAGLSSRAMETWDAIRARRNVREFSERPIDDADLEKILEAGRRAPSSKNWQPWDLVVVTERALLIELARVWRFGGSVA